MRPLGKHIRLALIAALAVALAGGVAYLSTSCVVVVAVVYDSGRSGQLVTVEDQGGVTSIGSLDDHQQATVRFPVRGETSFRIRARFGDGSELVSEQQYAECRYEFRATIGKTSIAMEGRLPSDFD